MVRQIEPTPAQKEGAVRSHNNLRDLMFTGQMQGRILTTYLSGSYSRDTAIRPLDDVDIIFVIDPSKWSSYFIFSRPRPDVILDSIARAIRYRYQDSSVFRQRRSVRLQLNHLDIDVVPAINKDSSGEFIYIPDRDADDWILSAPKRHTAQATRINQKRENRFKPLVKLLKFWNSRLPSTTSLKSFAIETLAVRLFDVYDLDSLEGGLVYFFDFIAYIGNERPNYRWTDSCDVSLNWLSTSIPDAAGTGTDLVSGVDSDRRVKFVAAATRSRNKMLQAQAAYSVETAWNRVSEALRA